jgi:hypothetical protein
MKKRSRRSDPQRQRHWEELMRRWREGGKRCKRRSKTVARGGACVTVEKRGALGPTRGRVSKACNGTTVTGLAHCCRLRSSHSGRNAWNFLRILAMTFVLCIRSLDDTEATHEPSIQMGPMELAQTDSASRADPAVHEGSL